jgi:cholest-4-en-3-one 26-monooxygenase
VPLHEAEREGPERKAARSARKEVSAGGENDEIVMFMTLLLVVGNETTRNAISGGMLALMQNRDQLELLRARPDLMDGAVEEILRHVSPIRCFRRTATRDTEIRGQAIRSGERVLML